MAAILALLPFAIGWRTPLFASWRLTALIVLIALPLAVIAAEVWTLRTRREARATRMLGGASRRFYHGVDRILPGTSRLLPKGGRINLTLRRVTAPA